MSTWQRLVCPSMFAALALACGDENPPTPSPDESPCERICERSAAAECAREPRGCEARCEALIDETPRRCDDELDAVTTCLARARFRCDEEEEASAPACEQKLIAWDTCVHGEEPGPAPEPDEPTPGEQLADACTRICLSSSLAHCANETYCDGCEQLPARTPAACGDAMSAMLSCRAGARYACDAEDDAETSDCQPEDRAFFACMEGHGAIPDEEPDAPACTPAGSDTPCAACQKDACCAELSACGADCGEVLDCYDACPDDGCYGTCDARNPVGAAQALALIQCVSRDCHAECVGGTPDPEPIPSTPEGCLPIVVDVQDNCAGTNKRTAYDCPSGSPFASCVLSPTGFANVFCCD